MHSTQCRYNFYFIPAIVSGKTPKTLLAFTEAHKACNPMSDKGWVDIAVKTSTNGGATWGPVRVLHSEYAQSHGTWVGNPAPTVDRVHGTHIRTIVFCLIHSVCLA